MIEHLLTAHPVTGAIRPLTPDLLREALLLPHPDAFDPMPVLAAQTAAPWADSFALAPAETAATICAELTGLILATAEMRPDGIDLSRLPDSRAARHLTALIDLWRALGDALLEGLDTIRRALSGEGVVLEPLPLLDLPLPDGTSMAIHALRTALVARFGLAPATSLQTWQAEQAQLSDGAPAARLLGRIQRHLLGGARPVPQDDSITIWSLRDLSDEAEACAAMVQRLTATGTRPRDIAVLVPEDRAYHRHLERVFARIGVPLSGLPQPAPERDLAGEALTHLLAALQTPAPAMAVASLYALPDMPWPPETGAALAREALEGHAQPRWAAETGDALAEITGLIARPRPADRDELRRRLDRFVTLLPDSALRRGLAERLNLLRPYLRGSTPPDWTVLTALASPRSPEPPEPQRITDGVSIIREGETPWRPATLAHDVLEHLFRPGAPLPLDNEIAERTPGILTEAIRRRAPFAQGALWAVERDSLTRETILAARNWATALRAMQAEIAANEVALRGEWHGISLRGFADSVLRLPGGDLLVVDHKKSRSGQRQERMQAGWDLQTELYRAMLRNPAPLTADAPPSPFAGANGRIGVAYHLLNDSGILCHGIEMTADPVTRISDDISVNALEMLKERLADVGAGRICLNSTEDADFFSKTCKFTPYALDASPLIAAFTIGESDAIDEAEE